MIGLLPQSLSCARVRLLTPNDWASTPKAFVFAHAHTHSGITVRRFFWYPLLMVTPCTWHIRRRKSCNAYAFGKEMDTLTTLIPQMYFLKPISSFENRFSASKPIFQVRKVENISIFKRHDADGLQQETLALC